MATVNADGLTIGRYMTGPFGETLPIKPSQLSNGLPSNTGNTTSTAYLGKYQKTTDEMATPIEGGIIQMGARPYIPALGRFVSVDPVYGGTDNNYVYPTDPVNSLDTNGEWVWFVVIVVVRVAAQQAAKTAAKKAVQLAAKRAAQKIAKKRAAAIAKKRAVAAATNRAASKWSSKSVMKSHFSKHGATMGYGSVIEYTNAASKIAKGRGILLKSGSRAYTQGNKVVLKYKGKIVSFFKSKNVNNWLKNNRK